MAASHSGQRIGIAALANKVFGLGIPDMYVKRNLFLHVGSGAGFLYLFGVGVCRAP